eukprot:scpid83114/ scgid10862/ 
MKQRFPSPDAYTWEDVWLSNRYVQRRYERQAQVLWRDAASWHQDWLYWLLVDERTFIKAMSIRGEESVDRVAKQVLLQVILYDAVATYAGRPIPGDELVVYSDLDSNTLHGQVYEVHPNPFEREVTPHHMCRRPGYGFRLRHLTYLLDAGVHLGGIESDQVELMWTVLLHAGVHPTHSIIGHACFHRYADLVHLRCAESLDWALANRVFTLSDLLPVIRRFLHVANENRDDDPVDDVIATAMLLQHGGVPELQSLSMIPFHNGDLHGACTHVPQGTPCVDLPTLRPRAICGKVFSMMRSRIQEKLSTVGNLVQAIQELQRLNTAIPRLVLLTFREPK